MPFPFGPVSVKFIAGNMTYPFGPISVKFIAGDIPNCAEELPN